jgi:putative MATE family efflux protein
MRYVSKEHPAGRRAHRAHDIDPYSGPYTQLLESPAITRNLTVGSPVRVIIWFTLPLLVGNLFQQLYAVTDAMVVGRLLGIDSLAAVGASGSLQFLLIGFSFGSSAGVTIPVARAFGAGDLPAMRKAVTAGIVVSAGIAVAITLIGTLGARTLLLWMGTPPELMGSAATFLGVLCSGAAATVAFNFLSSVIRALGDSRTPLLFLVVACLLNAGLVILFVGGLHMGVGGGALATVIAQAVSVLLCLILVTRRMPDLRLTRDDWRIGRLELSDSSRLGLTLGFQMSIVAVGAAVLQYGINRLGTEAVAAFTAATRVDQVALAPLVSIGVAMSTYVAQNRGAYQWRRIRTGVFRACVLSVGFAVVLGVVIYLFGTALVRLFVGSGSDGVVAMAHQYLVINSSLYAILAVLFVTRNALQGLGVTAVPTIAGVMELFARSFVGLVLIGQLGFLGACVAAPLAWVAALVPLGFSWVSHHRRLARLESPASRGQPAALQPTG